MVWLWHKTMIIKRASKPLSWIKTCVPEEIPNIYVLSLLVLSSFFSCLFCLSTVVWDTIHECLRARHLFISLHPTLHLTHTFWHFGMITLLVLASLIMQIRQCSTLQSNNDHFSLLLFPALSHIHPCITPNCFTVDPIHPLFPTSRHSLLYCSVWGPLSGSGNAG